MGQIWFKAQLTWPPPYQETGSASPPPCACAVLKMALTRSTWGGFCVPSGHNPEPGLSSSLTEVSRHIRTVSTLRSPWRKMSKSHCDGRWRQGSPRAPREQTCECRSQAAGGSSAPGCSVWYREGQRRASQRRLSKFLRHTVTYAVQIWYHICP